MHPDFDFDSVPESETPHSRRTGHKRGKQLGGWVLAIIAGILGSAVAVWGGMWMLYILKRENAQDDAGPVMSAFNSRFVLPGKPWKRDKDIQMRFHVHISMRSSEHNNGMALLFKDYRDRLPSNAEMLDEATGKLRSYFKGLEWEIQPKDGQTQLAGRPAQVLQFQGDDSDQVTTNGECYMLAFRGYGYWFFTWAPLDELEKDRESIHDEWARLRKGFILLDERKDWQEKPRGTEKVKAR